MYTTRKRYTMLDFMPLNLIIIIVVSVFTIILVSDETLDRAVRRVIDILPFTHPYA
jgi:hypothetical protein